MHADRKADRLERRVAQRQFDDPDVRATFDELSVEELIADLGQPTTRTVYAEAAARPSGRPTWQPGDGRPDLADDDPATMQRIGMCLASRIRSRLPFPLDIDRIHSACDWCDFPEDWLLVACEWATWHSRYVITELFFWRKSEAPEDRLVTYERAGRQGEYENPRWAAWFDLTRQERGRRLSAPSLGIEVPA